jgi:dinuclear metal center YbgI/SA1388 family protein
MASLDAIVEFLDRELRTREVPDYPGALNGLQAQNNGTVTHVAAAVDCSAVAMRAAAERGADFLLVHHGMFWGGATPLVGAAYDRVRLAVEKNIAVYSSHIPLDLHPVWGNNVLLAKELGLEPSGGFALMRGVAVGVSGEADVATDALKDRAAAFSSRFGTALVCTPLRDKQRTRRWAMCTGAGASPETVREALDLGVDTLIVGEGPHHTAVQATDNGLTIMYLGHYATETLGVRALASELATRFSIKSSFIEASTGL